MWLKKHLFSVIIVFLALTLSALNYEPGTFLSGWDTLHPEFNFKINLERVFFGVFREEQGLGAVAAHSHMADLPRILMLFLFDFFLPLSFLRYSFIFLSLIAGPLGMYYFLKRVMPKSNIGPFLGSIFYLLNLGTVQIFNVPFEMFVTQYAILPWLFLTTIKAIEEKKRKNFFYFFLASILSAPMAYAATLWYVFFVCFSIFLFIFILPEILKKKLFVVKKVLLLIFILFSVNSFWILPNFYFASNYGESVSDANINQLFSKQAFLYNKEFGNPKDIGLIKTFLFDWHIYGGENHFQQVLLPWIEHLKNPGINEFAVFLAILALFGLSYSLLRKNKYSVSLFPVFLFILFFLINDNPPTSGLYLFLQQKIPLFKEALRFPENKVLGIYIFLFSTYLAFAFYFVEEHTRKIKKIKPNYVISGLILAGLLYSNAPAFKGNLINPKMRIEIPSSYFQTFEWFNNQKDQGRIANLPIHSLWGWEYYDWYKDKKPSFQGAGFFWFGVKQPVLHRDFDRWNPKNQQYYKEMSYAIYSKNTNLTQNVINKYDISYLVFDKSVIAPENDSQVLFYDELEEILSELEKRRSIKKEKTYGAISIYKVNKTNKKRVLENIPGIKQGENYYQDFAYLKYGNYVSSYGVESLFSTLLDSRSKVNSDFIKIGPFGAEIHPSNSEVSLPKFEDLEKSIPVEVIAEKNGTNLSIKMLPLLPYGRSALSPIPIEARTTITEGGFVVAVNKKNIFAAERITEKTPFSLGTAYLNTSENNSIAIYSTLKPINIIPDFSTLEYSLSPCNEKKPSQIFGLEVGNDKNTFTLIGKNTPICMIIPLVNLIEGFNEKEYLLEESYLYQGDEVSYTCLAEIKNGACINSKSYLLSQNKQALIRNFHSISGDSFIGLALKFFLDTSHSSTDKSSSFSGVKFALYKPLYLNEFGKEIVEQSIRNVEKANIESLIIPYSGIGQLSVGLTELPKTDIFCNKDPFFLNRGIEKKIFKEKKGKYIEYKSEDGPGCDHFSYQNLSQDNAYLIVVKSKNISGLPLNLCVLNLYSKHCDVYSNLTSKKDLTTEIFVLPNMIKGESGYDINIHNLGVKGSPGINQLESVQIIPFPYSWLSEIYHGEKLEFNSILFDSSSFYDGWKAYKVKNSNFLVNNFNNFFPFILGEELKHVEVNGWEINNADFNSNKVSIVFLPQYLQYMGFGLLLLTSLLLLKLKA